MTFLQSLGLSKQAPRTNPNNTQQKPNSTQRSHQSKENSPVASSTEVNAQMLEAWVNADVVSVPEKARIAPKNAGKKLDFLS